MFKIKLLILFLISFTLTNCTNNINDIGKYYVKSSGNDPTYNIRNTLVQYLESMGLYDENDYDYVIEFSNGFDESTFVTNIDKTSDRKKITYNIEYRIVKKFNNFSCPIFIQEYKKVSSFIFAGGEFNISNDAADAEIKNNLIDLTTNDFIDDLLNNKRKDCKYRIEPKP